MNPAFMNGEAAWTGSKAKSGTDRSTTTIRLNSTSDISPSIISPSGISPSIETAPTRVEETAPRSRRTRRESTLSDGQVVHSMGRSKKIRGSSL